MRNPFPALGIVGLAIACIGLPTLAMARPQATNVFCQKYPDIPACNNGAASCQTCHTVPPARNLYGAMLEPESTEDAVTFLKNLPGRLQEIESADADEDGATNLVELQAGTSPSSPEDVPMTGPACEGAPARPLGYDVCTPDLTYTFKKVMLDVCGHGPTLQELEAFSQSPNEDTIAVALDTCLQSEHWLGRDGILWNLANPKIRPIQALKSGPRDSGPIPLADYDDDYNFFVYAMSGDRDVRVLMTGTYIVERTENPTSYTAVERSAFQDVTTRGFDSAQLVDTNERVGMLTQRWFLMLNTMFTAIPRTTAAQAYRSYLGYDISRLEGLFEVPGEPKDYDAKGVEPQECSVCHTTLDPLSYPFSAYEGIGGGDESGDYLPYSYAPDRLNRFVGVDGSRITQTPEAGVLLGKPVANLVEWGKVASESDAFARNVTLDLWRLFTGADPRPKDLPEFERLWRSLQTQHEYRVERMLHDLIKTEAYRVP